MTQLPAPFSATHHHHGDKAETPKAGSWWRLRNTEDELSQACENTPEHGLVFLVKEVRIIDGDIHSVAIHQHPNMKRHTTEFLYEEFSARFAPEPDGAALRAAEQQTVMETMARHTARITQVQTQPLEIKDQTPSPLAQKVANLPAALQGEKNTQIAQQAERTLQAAQAKSQALTAITKDMEASANLLTLYQKEQVAAMIAQVSEETKAAESTLEKLHTLTLFLGDHQQVTQLRDGESADSKEPLHFFQRMLYLDEEFAVHFLDEPFHWRDALELDTLFAAHPDLVTRLLPQPRSVVITRVRRHMRALPENADYATLFAHIEESQWDKALLILIRDGDRVFMVQADEDTANAQRLFPSHKEIADLYKDGWHKETTITPEDLAYSKSRSAHDQRGLFYKRFLVLFWGLHVRKALFGPFMEEEANWFDPEIQSRYFTFVHDEEAGLDAPGPSLDSWIAQQLKSAGPGDLMVIDTKVALDEYSCPAAYQNGHRMMAGDPRVQTEIVESEGPDLFVRVMLKKEWGRGGPKRQKLYLRRDGSSIQPDGCIGITHADSQTLTGFIDSRRDRVNYARTMAALAQARRDVVALETEEAQLAGVDKTALRLARAHTKWKALDGRTLTRVSNLTEQYAEALNDSGTGLVTPKGLVPVTKWANQRFPIDTPWYVAGDSTLTAHSPLSADTLLKSVTLDTWSGHEAFLAPGMREALEAIFSEANTGWDSFMDTDVLEQACKAVYDYTYNTKQKMVQRRDISWPVGFAITASWRRHRAEAYLISLRADPFTRLAQLGKKESAETWVKKLYGRPQSHVERLMSDPALTLEAMPIRLTTRMDTLGVGAALDIEESWGGHIQMLRAHTERDVLDKGYKRLLSPIQSQFVSMHQIGSTDYEKDRIEIGNWIDESTVFFRKDAREALNDQALSFKDVTIL